MVSVDCVVTSMHASGCDGSCVKAAVVATCKSMEAGTMNDSHPVSRNVKRYH